MTRTDHNRDIEEEMAIKLNIIQRIQRLHIGLLRTRHNNARNYIFRNIALYGQVCTTKEDKVAYEKRSITSTVTVLKWVWKQLERSEWPHPRESNGESLLRVIMVNK